MSDERKKQTKSKSKSTPKITQLESELIEGNSLNCTDDKKMEMDSALSQNVSLVAETESMGKEIEKLKCDLIEALGSNSELRKELHNLNSQFVELTSNQQHLLIMQFINGPAKKHELAATNQVRLPS